MSDFEEFLQSAGYRRDQAVVGTILESERPLPDEVERLYDDVAEEAGVESDSLVLEFVPFDTPPGGSSQVHVALWYDGDLSDAEHRRVARALRRRFGPPAPGRRKASEKASASVSGTAKAGGTLRRAR